jgi:hypothetical protein
MKRLLSLFLVFLAGCTALNERMSHLSQAETKTVVSVAREKILASGLVNDAKEIETVRNEKPNLSYYFIARPYADYSIYWRLNNKETVGVYGRGNILVLENAQATRGDRKHVKPGT